MEPSVNEEGESENGTQKAMEAHKGGHERETPNKATVKVRDVWQAAMDQVVLANDRRYAIQARPLRLHVFYELFRLLCSVSSSL